MCIRICQLMSHFSQIYDIILLSYRLKVQKRFPNIVYVCLCLTSGSCVTWPWPMLGESCQVHTDRPNITKDKQVTTRGLWWHQIRAWIIPQNKRNSVKGNAAYFNKSSSGNWYLLMKFQKHPAGLDIHDYLAASHRKAISHKETNWVPSVPH